METATLTQTDKAFYPTLGPFFVNAEVRQATGSPMTSTPAHRWTVAKSGRKVKAFAGLLPHKNGNAEFVAVFAEGNDADAKKAVIEGALADAKAQGIKEVRIMAKIENSDLYRELGFEGGVMRGGFRQFSKVL